MQLRQTHQRKVIENVIEGSDRPLSTQEVLTAAQGQKPGLGIATVYRTLKILVDSGWLAVLRLPNEPPRYECAGKPHHHHFYCRRCGRAYEVPGTPEVFEGLIPRGFMMEGHEVVLYGRCSTCAAGHA